MKDNVEVALFLGCYFFGIVIAGMASRDAGPCPRPFLYLWGVAAVTCFMLALYLRRLG